MLFSPADPDAHAAFRDHVATELPGGRHLVAHLDDGPWRILILPLGLGMPAPLAAALAAYPTAQVLVADNGWRTRLRVRHAHLLPEFAWEYFRYVAGPDLDLDYACANDVGDLPSVDVEPFAAEILGVLAAGGTDDALCDKLDVLVDRYGSEQVNDRLRSLASPAGVNVDDFYAMVDAWYLAAAA